MSWPSTVCTSKPSASKLLGRVLALRLLGHGVERDVVGVVDEDQVVELLVTGKLERLHRHAFLHAAVAGEADDVMIEDRVLLGVEARLGHLGRDGHADGVGDALPERARRGLHAARRVRDSGWPGVFESSWRKRLTSSSVMSA